MHTRNIIALILIVISLICLYPGLFDPILSIKVGASIPLLGNIVLYDSKQSIIKTIQTLREDGNNFVAFLILLFSVLVPIIKAVLLLIVLFMMSIKRRVQIYAFVSAIGKWSMADVFVVGVFIAFLATKSNDSIDAQLHSGFYYFLSYCIISVIAIQVMKIESKLGDPIS